MALFIVSMALIPLNDAFIKVMSESFSIFQILSMRAVVSLAIVLAIPTTVAALRSLKARTILKLMLRGMCLVCAMMFFFLPLATLSLAEVTAIFYTAPLIISVMSVPLFGEKLGFFRIGAVLIGFAGVLFIVAPGTSGFELTYIMPLFSAVSYAAFQLITRYLRNEAPVIGMVAVQNIIYFSFGTIGVLMIILLQPTPGDDSVSQFLLREWHTPQNLDFAYLLITGTIVLLLAFASTNIYSNLEATFIAPFEYVAMPTAVLWGIVFFGEWPSFNAWIGIVLIISGGLLMIYRESVKNLHVGSDIRMRAAATYSEAEEPGREDRESLDLTDRKMPD